MNDSFIVDLENRIENYFKNKSKKATYIFWIKTAFNFVFFFGLYFFLIFGTRNYLQMILTSAFLGFYIVILVANIAHDASHNSISKSRIVNKIAANTWNFFGLSKYVWELTHNSSHHALTNIIGYDLSIEHSGFIRISPKKELKKYHRFQHFYALPFYSIIGVIVFYIKDFAIILKTKRFGNYTVESHPTRELWISLLSKLWFIGVFVIIPKIILGISWGQILMLHLVFLLVTGLVFALILIPVHVVEGVRFKEPDESGVINTNFFRQQIENTVDFAPSSFWVNWFTGGLNTHVIHHLYPNVNHVHYYEMTKILQKTCEEHNVLYSSLSIPMLLYQHLKFLKKLGTKKDMQSQ